MWILIGFIIGAVGTAKGIERGYNPYLCLVISALSASILQEVVQTVIGMS